MWAKTQQQAAAAPGGGDGGGGGGGGGELEVGRAEAERQADALSAAGAPQRSSLAERRKEREAWRAQAGWAERLLPPRWQHFGLTA